MAKRFSPSPTKPVALPAEKPRAIAGLSWGWRTYVGAAVAAALVLAILWRVPVFRTPPAENGNMVAVEMQDVEQFMTEIAMLVDNALPDVYLDISPEYSAGVDEESMDYVVPSAEGEPLTDNSRKRGVSLC
jgi:hypothetical protein